MRLKIITLKLISNRLIKFLQGDLIASETFAELCMQNLVTFLFDDKLL